MINHDLSRWGDIPDDAVDIAEAALAFSPSTDGTADIDRYRTCLTRLCHGLERSLSSPSGEGKGATVATRCAQALAEEIAGRHGYRGEIGSFGDVDGANFRRVLDRRRGFPVALGVLYLHVGRSQGWSLEGVDFPGFFLVRLEAPDGSRAILDPFHRGAVLSPSRMRALLKKARGPAAELSPDNYRPMGNREVLLRLQNNLKAEFLRAGRPADALGILHSMLVLAPDSRDLWREIGMISAGLGATGPAITALERYLSLAPATPLRQNIASLLHELEARPPVTAG
ncbi:MAG: SirB1 family protein [Alphaproteobacteria bacterium]